MRKGERDTKRKSLKHAKLMTKENVKQDGTVAIRWLKARGVLLTGMISRS